MTLRAPVLRAPPELRAALDAHRYGLAAEVEKKARARARPCAYLRSQRVADKPLSASFLSRLFGGIARPTLPPLASKFGGVPYAEASEDWRGRRFLGQIDLSEVATVLPELPARGLLRLECRGTELTARWFAEPSTTKAVAAPEVASQGKWETRISMVRGWTLAPWSSLLEKGAEALLDGLEAWKPEGYDEDARDASHRFWGQRAGLAESAHFAPPNGASKDIADYEMILRLAHDAQADFGWAPRWIHVLAPREDLARGNLSRLVVMTASA